MSPRDSAGRMHWSRFWARAANIRSSSAVGASSRLRSCNRTRRICWPIPEPPGSMFSKMARPAERRRSDNRRIWVDLPLPSRPSKVMKNPRLVVDIVEDFLEVIPRFALGVLVIRPEQVRGVVGDHHRNVAPLVPVAAEPGDAFLRAEQRLCGRTAEGADRLGLEHHQLAEEELATDLHFLGLGRAVLRRPAFNDVADVYVRAFEGNAFFARGALDHLCQKLAGPADERDPLLVLIGTRAFADKDQPGLLIADPEDELIAAGVQGAAGAVADVGENAQKSVAVGSEGREGDDGLGRRKRIRSLTLPVLCGLRRRWLTPGARCGFWHRLLTRA